jgi:dipeptidase D
MPAVMARLQSLVAVLAQELMHAEPALALHTEVCPAPLQVLDWPSAQTLLDLVRGVPDGVLRFSEVQPGVVETSTNLGILKLGEEGPASLQHLIRSLVDSAKAETGSVLSGLYRLGGAEVRVHGDYPGWRPDLSSRLLPLFKETCERLQGRPPGIFVVHAGLECGILRALKPSMDCISFGPRIEHMHSPDERVNIASVELFFTTVTEVLARIPASV